MREISLSVPSLRIVLHTRYFKLLSAYKFGVSKSIGGGVIRVRSHFDLSKCVISQVHLITLWRRPRTTLERYSLRVGLSI